MSPAEVVRLRQLIEAGRVRRLAAICAELDHVAQAEPGCRKCHDVEWLRVHGMWTPCVECNPDGEGD
jgi:hypothetical protein